MTKINSSHKLILPRYSILHSLCYLSIHCQSRNQCVILDSCYTLWYLSSLSSSHLSVYLVSTTSPLCSGSGLQHLSPRMLQQLALLPISLPLILAPSISTSPSSYMWSLAQFFQLIHDDIIPLLICFPKKI